MFATLTHNGKHVILRKDKPAFLFFHVVPESLQDETSETIASMCRSEFLPLQKEFDTESYKKINSTLIHERRPLMTY